MDEDLIGDVQVAYTPGDSSGILQFNTTSGEGTGSLVLRLKDSIKVILDVLLSAVGIQLKSGGMLLKFRELYVLPCPGASHSSFFMPEYQPVFTD